MADEAETLGVADAVSRGDVIEDRRRNALIDFGIDPTDWPLSILRDEPDPTDQVTGQAVVELSPLSDEAWSLIVDVFPKPHANQILGWRETIDALITLTQSGTSWVKLGKHSEAIRARLHRSRPEQWDEIEQRTNGPAVFAAERENIVTLCTFARRYLAGRDVRANAAPTPTAVDRILGS